MSDALARFRQTEYVAIGYVTDAKEYLSAAARLNASGDRYIGFSPIYFLLCHAIELLLKAFILAQGGTERELKKQDIRHQLTRSKVEPSGEAWRLTKRPRK